MTPKKTMLSWSTGKDSAWATWQLQQRDDIELVGALCTINQTHQRTAMHAVRVELLKAQANALDLPLTIIELPYPCSNEQYQQIMAKATSEMRALGVEQMSFGDLFLEDIRQYRIDNMKDSGIEPIFPLWKKPTAALAREMIAGGLKSVVTCVDPKQLDASFAGREFNESFLADLPEGVDPCGENGEFHSFVYDGPMFRHRIPIEVGEVVERDGFVFADVVKC
ncbi:ATPase [Reinekea blandensis]|uniref:Diphthamide synthase domain-containing protein n=1 Tax=Reinekea blandensis MED297 TaxID=314283 RepID=A4BF63_9GAMM|nr:ATPase [Reinekea blandensis]EAR09176.1 hypothetical protein MED297_06833 [Reinekea sp. MED297] [Reinekea blandensis MED297]